MYYTGVCNEKMKISAGWLSILSIEKYIQPLKHVANLI